MRKSLRYYYFTSIATVLVASVLVMGLIQIYLSTTYFQTQNEMLLEKLITNVRNAAASEEIGFGDGAQVAVDYMADIAGADVVMADPAGRIFYVTEGTAPLLGQQISPRILEAVGAQGLYRELGRLDGLFSQNFYTSGTALAAADGQPAGYVFASTDAMGLRVYMSDVLSSFILAAALVLLVSSMLALVLTNRTVIPLRRVNEAARQFGEGNYAARVPVDGDDELAQLALTFNEMANSFEATDSSRRSFMGNIAHELRTPMTTIKGFIDGMLDGTIPAEQRDKYLAIVSEEVGRLARLTKNMLDISRLESGEYTPDKTVFDIWGPIASVFISVEQRLAERGIEVQGIEPENPVNVLADKDFVHQILFNLVDNAIKFSPEGGAITVAVKPGKTGVTVSIRNVGEGIAAEVLPYIFDRFYKEDKSRGVNVKGSGLGLHICKVLVNLMGGRIWAESEVGAWSALSFTLPNAPQKRTGARRTEPKTRPAASPDDL